MCYIVADNIDFMDYKIFNNANDLAYQRKKHKYDIFQKLNVTCTFQSIL